MSVHPTKTMQLIHGEYKVNQPLPESDRHYLSYDELSSLFLEYNSLYPNQDRKSFFGYIKFDSLKSWNTENATEQSCTYYFDSEATAYQKGKIGNSIYACCCDGTDYAVKLSNYLAGWAIEFTYMHKEDYAEIIELISNKQGGD